MPRTHSPKTIETLRQLGCDTTGWAMPPIEWRTERRCIPMRVPCPQCAGRGRVPDLELRALVATAATPQDRCRYAAALQACPTCPGHRTVPQCGSGWVMQLVERDVEVGVIVWPEHTRFSSRFSRYHSACQLCGKTVQVCVPVLGTDATGAPQGMWVGEDCARTLLGVAYHGKPIEIASADADARADRERGARALWREIKPTRPPKPVKPSLGPVTDRTVLHAILQEAFGAAIDPQPSVDQTRAEVCFLVLVTKRDGRRSHVEVKQTLRGGIVVREAFNNAEIFFKDKAATDMAVALRTALPKIAMFLDLPINGS